MEITKEEREILKGVFNIYEDSNIYELANWTNGGVNMIITIQKFEDKNLIEQLVDCLENFDINAEIDIHRENKLYKDNFTIRESLEDFENWQEELRELINQLEEVSSKKEMKKISGIGIERGEDSLKITIVGFDNEIIKEYEVMLGFNGQDDSRSYCKVANKIKDLYYNKNGDITREDILTIIREEFVQ